MAKGEADVGEKVGGAYTLKEVGRIECIIVIYWSDDSEGGEAFAFGGSGETERSDQCSVCLEKIEIK